MKILGKWWWCVLYDRLEINLFRDYERKFVVTIDFECGGMLGNILDVNYYSSSFLKKIVDCLYLITAACHI